MDDYSYRGFEIKYMDLPTMGHWECDGKEFDSDLAAERYVDTIHDTLKTITEG